jgi:hypothetical protein
MVVNFRTRGISRGVRKLAQTLTLIKKKKKKKKERNPKISKLKHLLLIPLVYVDIFFK